jgi:hypothetical protein
MNDRLSLPRLITINAIELKDWDDRVILHSKYLENYPKASVVKYGVRWVIEYATTSPTSNPNDIELIGV